MSPGQSQLICFGEFFKLLQIWWSTGMDLGLQFNPQIFDVIQVRALCRLVKNVHFVLLEVVLHQERCMFCVVMLEDKAMTQTRFCCWLLELFFQNLYIFFFLHCSFYLGEIPSSRHTEASQQDSTHIAVFHCGDGVLCVVCLSLLSLHKSSISMAKEL